ncbi:hypothetical protein X743_10020 [Mesorhizobium sp. LNHC252B00]|nr:hypothetical protein X743_10020 [Mesorhizobium sp. LNHC252B00]
MACPSSRSRWPVNPIKIIVSEVASLLLGFDHLIGSTGIN